MSPTRWCLISFIIWLFSLNKPHPLFFMMYFVIFIAHRCFNIKLLQTIIFVFVGCFLWDFHCLFFFQPLLNFFLAPPLHAPVVHHPPPSPSPPHWSGRARIPSELRAGSHRHHRLSPPLSSPLTPQSRHRSNRCLPPPVRRRPHTFLLRRADRPAATGPPYMVGGEKQPRNSNPEPELPNPSHGRAARASARKKVAHAWAAMG